MVDAVWGRLRRVSRRDPQQWFQLFLHAVVALRWLAAAAALAFLGWLVAGEMRTSYLQSRFFTGLARGMTYTLGAGPSGSIRFPGHGPYDERLGYAGLPGFIAKLKRHSYFVARQARWSAGLDRFVDRGFYAVYPEKRRAGLELFDEHGSLLYRARYPHQAFKTFQSVPPVVAATLSFIEDQKLLDFRDRRRNPAVEWDRFSLAAAGRAAGLIDRHWRRGGASTLATQLEKLRHSPGGVTPGVAEKFRQMVTASAKAYRTGPDTRAARRRILADYLDSTPLGSRPRHGEIIGLPDALWNWYGTPLAEAERVLMSPARSPAALARKGEIYRQVLGLLLADRRPAYYLVTQPAALGPLTDRYLRLLAQADVIGPRLRDAALKAHLHFVAEAPPPATPLADRGADHARNELAALLGVPNLYALDRLDLKAKASLDLAAEQRVAAVLARLGDRAYDRSLGLFGRQLLGAADPGRIEWSFVLYERGAGRNSVRIDASSPNLNFDLNSGGKLQLGSTAKLRTLITYLDIFVQLHARLAPLSRRQLDAVAAAATDDPLTRWAAEDLARYRDRSLGAMLGRAMQRRYSAAPATFFTGGGRQSFANFSKWENYEKPTVAVAFHHSINLAFVRLLRDVVRYYIAQDEPDAQQLLSDRDDPQRLAFLHRFAARDGERYLDRFYRVYHGKTPAAELALLAAHTRPSAKRLAIVFRTVRPNASREALGRFLTEHLRDAAISDDRLWDLYRGSSPRRVSLRDRGYIAGVHPLELWLVAYLRQHPDASRAAVLKASTAARESVYGWLFHGSRATQNRRIRTLLEADAFDRILQNWQQQGYPFDHLVPSLGTALGSSGDRPDALATLMGTIVDGGIAQPTVDLDRLDFAAGTPYETVMAARPQPRRVMAPEVAATLHAALSGVVADGTASRLRGTYRSADGQSLPVGGKTGTGDNRFDRWGRGGALVSERVVDRTATFVFFLGDRFFGTVTAYVPGAIAGEYHFSSALAVQLLRALEPQLQPLLHSPPATALALRQARAE